MTCASEIMRIKLRLRVRKVDAKMRATPAAAARYRDVAAPDAYNENRDCADKSAAAASFAKRRPNRAGKSQNNLASKKIRARCIPKNLPESHSCARVPTRS